MIDHRRTAAAAALVGVVPFVLTVATAGAAQAHGAPTDPVSRVAACSSQGVQRASAACRAAIAVNGGSAFEDWDNLRVAGVRGRDRQFIPDGQLCSAGLDAFKGLDLPRTDWPATPLTAGSAFTLTYRSTIPHEGTFSLYLTKQSYDPAQPLTWDDLQSVPFAKATDPELRGGSYRISGRLPDGLTGRHVLYTIWRNSSTPDTYYSCSDVVMADPEEPDDSAQGGPEPSVAPPADTSPATLPPSRPPTGEASPTGVPVGGQQAVQPPAEPVGRSATAAAERENDSAVIVGGAASVLALFAVVLSVVLRRRAAR
ncbi:chitin-binding protein [Streptomyces sp. SLBN-118]|uniref:lytic polysaccharide monooxygenase auxiliary activity family 9 protein n=1 Tax=Streptomyces sp. SLBN-118 TaxID=2768454 RepID=UPI0011515577|nr:lytic polysaccharide monooxygenase [Streptomyces sp. SLBN-118]TQK42961.1 chitin-binding protein [Streptomyces sp. SLBN-118]